MFIDITNTTRDTTFSDIKEVEAYSLFCQYVDVNVVYQQDIMHQHLQLIVPFLHGRQTVPEAEGMTTWTWLID